MKIVVDRHACEGNARCSDVAPEIFEVRDDDKAFVKLENPPANLTEKLKLAVKLCPRQAISIED
jgi:ferredoxin